jgi:lipoprotein NlpD
MIRVLIVGALAVVLNACTNQRWDPDDYPVRSGDTIYSIAWKYELDPFELARWNNLSSPYRIYPGQRLNMKPEDSDATASRPVTQTSRSTRTTTRPGTVTVRKGDTLYGIARRHNISASELASINGIKSPYTIRPGQTLKLRSTRTYHSSPATRTASTARTTSTTRTKSTTGRTSTSASLPADNRNISWQWPVHGKLITTFKSNKTGRKGIDIAGSEGKAIKAAAPGKVVYSGNGLISYGNLVIIKHNRAYLSAYAHNRRLLVKEGDTIKAGQKIAELGKTGTDSPRLHFEIRKNGKPVNPLKYLPSS